MTARALYLMLLLAGPHPQAVNNCKSNADCGARQFCLATACGAEGTCRARPEMCAEMYDPVCGCDGKTYSNACAANEAGTTKAKKGACAAASPQCTTAADCHGLLPHLCQACADGKEQCAHFVCKESKCAVEVCPR